MRVWYIRNSYANSKRSFCTVFPPKYGQIQNDTTVLTYSHQNTPIDQWERAQYLSYFIKKTSINFELYLRQFEDMFLSVYHLQCAILKQQIKNVLRTRLTAACKDYDKVVTCLRGSCAYNLARNCTMAKRQVVWRSTGTNLARRFNFSSRRDLKSRRVENCDKTCFWKKEMLS